MSDSLPFIFKAIHSPIVGKAIDIYIYQRNKKVLFISLCLASQRICTHITTKENLQDNL